MTREPDCATCYKKDTCEKAQEGTFCPMWRSEPPAPRGEDPNDRWRRGEEEAF